MSTDARGDFSTITGSCPDAIITQIREQQKIYIGTCINNNNDTK